MGSPIRTIGHSTLPIQEFIELLQKHRITAIADVRSSPYSRFNPQFNREALKRSLSEARIHYVFLGAELGARSDDPACYANNKVQYGLLAKTLLFQSGLSRVIEGAEKHCIALMCAEKEPLDCHRTILVSRELIDKGQVVAHILADGTEESHASAMARLMEKLGIPRQDMFRSEDQILDEAYFRQAEKIAYDRSSESLIDSANLGEDMP